MGWLPLGAKVALQLCFWATALVCTHKGWAGPSEPDAPTEVPDVAKLLHVAQEMHGPFTDACAVLGARTAELAAQLGGPGAVLAGQIRAEAMAVAPWAGMALLAFVAAAVVCVGGAALLTGMLVWLANLRIYHRSKDSCDLCSRGHTPRPQHKKDPVRTCAPATA